MLTTRLRLRLPIEPDRERFVGLFGDEEFMVFSGGALSVTDANIRFDGMLERAAEFPYAKQPIIDPRTDVILGYVGVNRFDLEGSPELEFGYRLVPAARGRGYATEAAMAVMDIVSENFTGDLYAMIDPRNEPSQRVADKIGFEFLRMATVAGYLDRLYIRRF